MARTTLDKQLNEIKMRIIHLGSLVEMALEQAIEAIRSNSLALCGLVIESDRTIDEVRSDVEQLAFQSLTLQQPLAGQDLRFLSSAPAIAGDLERMGDNAEGIAQLLLRMAPLRQGIVSQDMAYPSARAAPHQPTRLSPHANMLHTPLSTHSHAPHSQQYLSPPRILSHNHT